MAKDETNKVGGESLVNTFENSIRNKNSYDDELSLEEESKSLDKNFKNEEDDDFDIVSSSDNLSREEQVEIEKKGIDISAIIPITVEEKETQNYEHTSKNPTEQVNCEKNSEKLERKMDYYYRNNNESESDSSNVRDKFTSGDKDGKNIYEDEKKKEKNMKTFLKGVKADILNKDLLPLKILFFFKYATLFVLYPYLTLHLKSLGFDASEAGINSAFIPIVAILGPPMAGMVADKIGNFKYFLTGMTLINAPLALCLLLVPKARESVDLSQNLTFNISCDINRSQIYPYSLQLVDSSNCSIPSSLEKNWSNLPPALIKCGKLCSSEIPPLIYSPLANNFKMPDQKSFFPSSNPNCGNGDCSKDVELLLKDVKLNGSFGNMSNPIFNVGKILGNEEDFGFLCDKNNTGVYDDDRVNYSKCQQQCLVQFNRTLFCSNSKELKVYDVKLSFALYTLIRIFLGLASATSFIMFEGAVMAILKEFGGDYGLQRVSATLAAIIAAPLAGGLIQVFNDFYPAFYLYAILQVFSALLTLKIDLTFKQPAGGIIGHLKEVLSQVEILIFFFAMLLSGVSWGYIESFLFWFLQDLKASSILMGLTISVGGLAGIPFLIFSRPIIKQFGHVNVLAIGLIVFSIRLIGYSFIEDPWLCLPFEAMEAITASLAITSAATYAAALSTPTTIASIQGIWGGLYFGFGRGAGSLLGGFLNKWYGARNTFRIFSLMALTGGILYFIVNKIYIEKYSAQMRKVTGLNLNDIRGDREKRREKNREANEREGEKKIGGNGYIGPCEINSFTDIPLDEESNDGRATKK